MSTRKTERSYGADRACLGLSVHLYRAHLAANGPAHRETVRHARQAQRNAGYVIAAGMTTKVPTP